MHLVISGYYKFVANLAISKEQKRAILLISFCSCFGKCHNIKIKIKNNYYKMSEKKLHSECEWIFRTCTNAINVYITMMHFIFYDNILNLQEENSGKSIE